MHHQTFIADRPGFPFSAIVGQDKLKMGLFLNVINPTISGLLIRGEKGTAKSTAVRALADILPSIEVVKGCPFQCDPNAQASLCFQCQSRATMGEKLESVKRKVKVVELPLSATEDRVVGTLNMEHALKHGEKKFEPGILAAAHRGILYIDEVNLLDDHVVDVLLDCAAMGVNTVEREGISFSHPAKFTLVGTMNPEEGELRPQLQDRFGLCVQVEGITDPHQRVAIVKRRAAFEADPFGFTKQFEAESVQLSQQIDAAIHNYGDVVADDDILFDIARLAIEAGVDGHRSDIVMLKTAKAVAAFHNRKQVSMDEVAEAASLVLPHRMRRLPFDDVLNMGSKKVG
ncbi:MAG: ATP-binding protein [Deltaproteobacteria bacterium]|nr:ATP-binding protein [Deltaproteobacteria bacterium]